MDDNNQANQKEDRDTYTGSVIPIIEKRTNILFSLGILVIGIAIGAGATFIIPLVPIGMKVKTQVGNLIGNEQKS